MAILPEHLRFYEEIFRLPGVVRGRVLTIGVQDLRIHGKRAPAESLEDWTCHMYWRIRLRGKSYKPFTAFCGFDDYLLARGAESITTLDLFDEKSDIKHNLNEPIPDNLKQAFELVIDIGNTEHVFDTRQCVENLFECVKIGGHILLHLPVSGYFAHGLHVFNPQGLIDALLLNGFDLCFLEYSSRRGKYLKRPHSTNDTLIWLVAKKLDCIYPFRVPQQSVWNDYYAESNVENRIKLQKDYWKQVGGE